MTAILMALLAATAAVPVQPAANTPLTIMDFDISPMAAGPPVMSERAKQEQKPGSASAICTVSPEGMLTTCKVVQETPLGYGFGDAVLGMASRLRLPLKTKAGVPAVGKRFLLSLAVR